jgi:hypothetical protein
MATRHRPNRARTTTLVAVALLGILALTATACSSGDDRASTKDTNSSTPRSSDQQVATAPSGPPAKDKVATPTVVAATGGKGTATLLPPTFDLAAVGYTESEFFISGTASAYGSAGPLASDGRWTVTPEAPQPYTTRIVVRRPVDPAKFDGTVVVEWLNVSGGLDASPDWTFTHTELIRSGSIWVGVSAQKVGIDGGGNSLGAKLALKRVDPARYGSLVHPGDDYSYDIFSQAGAAVWFDPATVLGGPAPQMVLAAGESQSAFRMTTYINAVAPLTGVYDGYLVHSRAAAGAPLSTAPRPEVKAPTPTYTRTDQAVPVLTLSSESDLTGDGLGYARARQDDTDSFRGWEVAGTAHGDAYLLGIGDSDDGSGKGDTALFDAMSNPPKSVDFDVIKCDSPINTGPQTYVARSAVSALREWVRSGTPPPKMPRLELDAKGTGYELDANGNAAGGIRTPQVDVPIAKLSGLGQTGGSFCFLFGTTTPKGPPDLARAYPTHDAFVTAWNASVDDAAAAGAVLPQDAERLRQVAAASTIGNPAG